MKKNNYIKKPVLQEDKENLLVEESKNESFSLSNMQFGNNISNTNIISEKSEETIKSEPEDFFFDYYGNVSLKDNFTIYFNSVVYSYSVDMAMDLLQQVNRNIAITKLQYPELTNINVKFIINSPGGEVIQGLRLFDAIKNNIYPITTIASGEAASMGVILLVAGKTVKASENTTLLIHQLSAGMGGKYSVMKDYMDFYDQLQNKLTSLLVQNSNAKKEDIINFMKGESFILAPEAKKLGIIDEVIPTI